MYKDINLKISVAAKIFLIILFKFALTEGMSYMYYVQQRRITFVLFIIIAFIAGRQNKYFSCLIAIMGLLIFNPFKKPRFTGQNWDLVEWMLIGVLMVWIAIDLYNYFVVPKKGRGILNALKRNKKTKEYEVTDSSVTYSIPPSMIKGLRKYMYKSNLGSMYSWYKTLSPEEKKKITRTALHDEPLED
ncbi:DUF6804 family protein [Ferruginibacter sp. SUN002]|uniref:DUF6804 family protein n=1 Tax=Ferruginibacter sp. SUN002 TaxID=2937789 RepID=UPI003D3603AF